MAERFSYLLVQRRGDDQQDAPPAEEAAWSRIVRPPRVRSKHVMLDVCTGEGDVRQQTLSKGKHARAAYRQARKARLGEAWHWPASS